MDDFFFFGRKRFCVFYELFLVFIVWIDEVIFERNY